MGNKIDTNWNGAANAVFMLIADGECDQIVDDVAIAHKEKKDLEKLGCVVKVRIFTGGTKNEAWAKAEAYEDKLRGY